MQNKTLYLVDGNSLVYRSFYAIKLSTSKGFPTGAVYGFLNTIKRIKEKYKPDYMAICFDVSRKTHRQEKFKEYKIQRPPVPNFLKVQIPIVKELITYFGIKRIEKEGYEADDLIASIVFRAYRNKWPVMIVTSDKDMYQLIDNDTVCIYNPFKDVIYNYERFTEEFGFVPQRIVDYLSLVGDSVDNIPGAKGIGRVGALSLIKKFGTIEDIFKHLDKIPYKTRSILEKNKENIFLSRDLVKLSDVLEFDCTLEDFKIEEPDYDNIYRICRELEFKSLLKDIPSPKLNINIDVKEGLTSEFRKQVLSQRLLFVHVEGKNCYIFDREKKNVYSASLEEVGDFLANDEIRKVSYDFKRIYHILSGKIFVRNAWFDIMIAAYLLNPSLGDYSLENLCAYFLKVYVKEIPPSSGVYFIAQLYSLLEPKIEENSLDKLLFEIEMPLVEVIAKMEEAGVSIDRIALEELDREVDEKIGDISSQIFKIAETTFNLNSPLQLRRVLFEKLKLPPQKKTKTGYSTDEEVLRKLAVNYPIAKLLLDYRQFSKLKSTYLAPFKQAIGPGSSKIYAVFSQTATQTGRLSSHSPNLQNIPIKEDFTQKIRRIFVPSFKGGCILSSDYSQVELRVLAHFSREDNLIRAFNANTDIHKYTASLLFSKDANDITKREREIAKRVNFGIVYGMSSYGLARELNVSEEEARQFIESYFMRYPKVKEFIDSTIKEAEEKGYVRTIMGRIRYLPDINSSNYELREFSRRQAVNTPIQGTAADIIKMAMVRIYREFERYGFSSRLILQVHDELVFDVEKKELKKVVDIVKYNMENSISLIVPLIANLKVGKNWLELEPLYSNNEIRK